MIRKSIIVAAAAAVVSIGGIAAAPSTALAANAYVQTETAPVVGVHYKRGHHAHRPQRRWQRQLVRVCKPVFRHVVRYDRWHRPHWKKVKVGSKCHLVPRRHHQVRRWR